MNAETSAEADEAGLRIERADGVLTLTFDRPESGNAIPSSWTSKLIDLFEGLNTDPTVRALLLRAEGPHYSLGGDVRAFAAGLDRSVAEMQAEFRARLDRVSRLVTAFVAIDVPIVAACQGGIAGAGLMYPLGADYVLGAPDSFLVFAHQRIGLTPDGGVSYLLPRVVGQRMAGQLLLTGARVDAAEAQQLGMISQIVERDRIDEEARAQARRFARAPAEVMGTTKRLVRTSLATGLAKQLDAERDAIVASVGHPDFGEGVRAFVEKRAPSFPSCNPRDHA